MADDLPLFTLDKSLVVSGFWTSAIPQGYSNTVEILASGKVPGMLEPGESVTVPVYYAGMQKPWNFSESQFKFDLRIFTRPTRIVDWPAAIRAAACGISNAAWQTIYGTWRRSCQLGRPIYGNPRLGCRHRTDRSAPGAATSSFWTTRRPTSASSART